MPYIIKRKYFNGYRCSCCYQEWESVEVEDTLEDAIAGHLPEVNEGGDFDPLKIKIIDGATGETLAWGKLEWPMFGGYSGNRATRWHGYNGTENFDSAGSKEEWEKTLRGIEIEIEERQLREAEQKAEASLNEMDRIQKRLKKLSQ